MQRWLWRWRWCPTTSNSNMLPECAQQSVIVCRSCSGRQLLHLITSTRIPELRCFFVFHPTCVIHLSTVTLFCTCYSNICPALSWSKRKWNHTCQCQTGEWREVNWNEIRHFPGRTWNFSAETKHPIQRHGKNVMQNADCISLYR